MRAAEITAQIERSAAWWLDHGASVRQDSAAREGAHYSRMLYDPAYRERDKLGEAMNRAAVRRQGLNRPSTPSRHVEPGVWGEMTDLGDRIGRTMNNDGMGFVDSLEGYESKKNVFIQDNAERQFKEFAQEETGMELSAEELKKLRGKTRVTMRQSKAIAAKLLAAGAARAAALCEICATVGGPMSSAEVRECVFAILDIFDPYRHDAYGLFVYWIHSKTMEQLPAYRRTCLLPYIAAMTRAPKLAALEYFIQEHVFCKFWTFTTGDRCNAYEIPARLDWMFNRLKELNKQLSRRWGVQIVFRTTEFGTLEADAEGKRILPANARADQMLFDERETQTAPGRIERDADGQAMFHPHAHCVVYSSRGHIGEEWGEVIKYVHKYWRRGGKKIVWLADGIIRDARECCKYVTKPGDIIKLSDADLAAFADATRGRRLVRPMGILADEIRDRKENGRILRRSRNGGKMKWRVVLNQNRLTSETEQEKADRENLQDAYDFTEECEGFANVAAPSEPGKLDGGSFRPRVTEADVCRVMARIGPAAGPTPLKEPRVIIMTNRQTPDLRTINAHPLVQRLWSDTIEQWEAGRVLSGLYNVHTGTLTGKEIDSPEFDLAETAAPPVHLHGLLNALPAFA